MAQTFTKNERLCSFTEINSLVKDGSVLFSYPFRTVYQQREGSGTKILISVPKKNFKRAVHRNLLKRRIRESYRKNREVLGLAADTGLNIMFIYVGKDILEYNYIESKLKDILGKITKALA